MTEQQHQARENLLAAAAIRAMVCASRGLPPSSGCRACGATEAPQCDQCVPGMPEPLPADSEGGELD